MLTPEDVEILMENVLFRAAVYQTCIDPDLTEVTRQYVDPDFPTVMKGIKELPKRYAK